MDGSLLVAGDGHALYQDRTARAAVARHYVAAYRRDSVEHLPQIAGDGDLLDREADLAALHPVAGRAARVVAGHEVDALSHQLGDEQTFLHMLKHSCEVRPFGAHEEVVMAAR